jgi:hypothetical protein
MLLAEKQQLHTKFDAFGFTWNLEFSILNAAMLTITSPRNENSNLLVQIKFLNLFLYSSK